ncbi:hypothetical protein AAG906_010518 [Vitis piasezkii]
MVAPNKRNVRGKTRGVILDKLIEANGANLFRSQSIEINTMLDRIKEKFSLDLTQEHVKKTLQKFPSVVEAKRNPHESVSNQEDWDYLCDRFSTINSLNRSKMPFHHRGGSRSFIQHGLQSIENGEMVGQIELFKLVHWKSQDGWINKEAEICEKVLGQKSRYVKGLGFGPKPISFSKSIPSSSSTQLLVETQQDQIDQLEALVQKQNQQHHQQFEEILRHLLSSQGSS